MPVLSITPLSVAVEVGNSLELHCEATPSWPAPIITWWLNNISLTNTGRITITQPDLVLSEGLYTASSHLLIPNSLPSDTGRYSCRAMQSDVNLLTFSEQATVIVDSKLPYIEGM